MQLTQFYSDHLYDASLAFFKGLNMPVKELGKQTYDAQQLLDDKFLPNNEAHQLLDNIYLVGLIDDDAFQGINKGTIEEIDNYKEYDGILVLAVELKERRNNLLPTRTHLSQLTRAFNRKFPTTPAVIIYRYDEYIAFANVERLAYKQEWKQAEGEKAGKVSLLRDVKINPEETHSGHLKILEQIEITRTGKKGINSLEELYKHWQTVFSVSILSKAFYEELFHWYLWAVKNVTFPNKPTLESVVKQYGKIDNNKLEELVQEHKAKNIIRLLTRLLFVWFIKEKGLIPEELFDLDALQKDILKNISPYKQVGLLKETNSESIFYKAILQNLFFAALNCPIDASNISGDTRKRGFRDSNYYGQNRGADFLMRYEKYFKKPDKFLELVNTKVPFLNGGLFECLDDKPNDLYIDGFSDNMKKGEQLIVPDFLFFGLPEKVNLTKEYGIKKKGVEKSAVTGLINILKSYKFTIAENTPIEEDIALDPELLGKVFENLLASYNPETKTTARKQTGSFYTPREIVDYMVDESLIAYLKPKILQEHKWQSEEGLLEQQLHQLFSYDNVNPFEKDEATIISIINQLDDCKILDPACGSGAFPMGVLQKMVHILGKLDKGNTQWRKRQIDKVRVRMGEEQSKASIKEIREQLIDIEKAFDENDSDYARKLYLIENCIYGVDIQPIATQISKLRFFISLIVDQNVISNKPEDNFGIRPLPNLETKFVTANTLIGIEKPDSQLSLFETTEVKKLELDLKRIRHKIFSAKSKETKTKYRQEDERLRQEIANKLLQLGWATTTATQLAEWDPFDQNYIAPFFDAEWMFGIVDGFDTIIGNPPYRPIQKYDKKQKTQWSKQKFDTYANSGNIYFLFYERGLKLTKKFGSVTFITSNQWLRNISGEPLRKFFLSGYCPKLLVDFRGTNIFENVAVLSNILLVSNLKEQKSLIACDVSTVQSGYSGLRQIVEDNSIYLDKLSKEAWLIFERRKHELRESIVKKGKPISEWGLEVNYGIKTGFNKAFYLTKEEKDELLQLDERNGEIIHPMLRGKDLARYTPNPIEIWLINTYNGKNAGKGVPRTDRVDVIKDYPVVYQHLLKFDKQLEKRGDKGEHWTNLRSCAYNDAFNSPKMIFMNMSKDLIFSYDSKGEYLTNQKCFIVTGKHIRYLTAFFNSKLFRYFYKDNFPELLGDVREVSKVYFEKIPVLLPDKKSTILVIEQLVEILVHLKTLALDNIDITERIVESLILEIYFPTHLKEKQINILEYVEKDLLEVLKGTEFEELADDKKEKGLENLYQRWSNSQSEIQKRISLFKERSPDILKPILESR